MTEKRKVIMERLGAIMNNMSEKALDDLLLLGEGMVIMNNLMRNRSPQNADDSADQKAG